MTAEEFKIFWQSQFPRTVPLSFRFKKDYPDRWLRIHSLPESKRYPEGKEEWDILLKRQNSIITDLFGANSPILIIVGQYYFQDTPEDSSLKNIESISGLPFTSLEPIDLNKIAPEYYDSGQFSQPLMAENTWQANKFDDILYEVALDQLRTFFISIEQECIIAPYDGGVDLILKDTQARDLAKVKYKDWLSARPDGL